jgi:hypothetical protein
MDVGLHFLFIGSEENLSEYIVTKVKIELL